MSTDIRKNYGPAVARIAAIVGATDITELGDGGEGEFHCTFFALHTPLGTVRGATTNADPVWEEEDSAAFADLAAACGVDLAPAAPAVDADKWLTPAEAAELTDTSESHWRNRCASGQVAGAFKKGKQWLIPRATVAGQTGESR
jgi:hypothetical protein